MEESITIGGKMVQGFTIPLGPVNIVMIVGSQGVLGCGAIDVSALERFGVPAVRIAGKEGRPISKVEELLAGVVTAVNEGAARKGARQGMSGMDAAALLV